MDRLQLDNDLAADFERGVELADNSARLDRLRQRFAVPPEETDETAPPAGKAAAPAAAPAAGGQPGPAKPAPAGGAPGASDVPGPAGARARAAEGSEAGTGGAITATLKDILAGGVESAPQIAGGLLDAANNTLNALDDLNKKGEGLGLLDAEISLPGAEEADFLPTTEEAESVTGGLIRSTTQFLAGFAPFMRAVKGISAGSRVLQAAEAGALADLVVWDQHEERLSTWLNQVPALAPIVPDYLADNNPENETVWEGRLKQAIEGAGLGMAVDGLFHLFRYYKSARAATAAAKTAAMSGRDLAQQSAADAMRGAATADIVQPLQPGALDSLGDEAGSLFIGAPRGETVAEAVRLEKDARDLRLIGEALPAGMVPRFTKEGVSVIGPDRKRVAVLERPTSVDETFLGTIGQRIDESGAIDRALASVRERIANVAAAKAAAGQPVSADPLDEMLNIARSGAGKEPALEVGRFPTISLLRSLGGVKPGSPLAQELAARDVTARRFPGLFRKTGVGAADNIPAGENPRYLDQGDGYIDPDDLIAAIDEELGGNPRLDPERQEAQFNWEEGTRNADEFRRDLEDLGVDFETMDNAAIRARLDQVDAERARIRDMEEAPPALTEEELQSMDADDLDRMAFGHAGGDVVELSADEINIRFADDLENPQDKFDRGGMAWAQSVDLSDPVQVKVGEDGKFYLADGHHRWFAAQKTGRPVKAEIEIEGNPVRAILARQEAGPRIRDMEETPGPEGEGDFGGLDIDEGGAFEEFVLNDIAAARLDQRLKGAATAADRERILRDIYGVTAGARKPGAPAPDVEMIVTEAGARLRGLGAPSAEIIEAQQKLRRDFEEMLAEPEPKIYINHARINSTDDVKALIQQMADEDADAINVKRRGIVPNKQTLEESRDEFTRLGDLIAREPGPMSAAEAVAARKILTASGEQLVTLATKASGGDATAADLFAFRRAMQVHYAIQSEVIAARTETARALQSWAIPAGNSKQRADAIAELLNREGGAGDSQRMANMIVSLANNPAGMNAAVQKSLRGKVGDALFEAWINGLLSSPKTHMVNITSNNLTAFWSIPERYLAAGISNVFYGGEIQMGEAAAAAFGIVKGMRDGIRLAVMGKDDQRVGDLFNAFVKGARPFTPAISSEAFELSAGSAVGRAVNLMGAVIRTPGTALDFEDRFFKSVGYRMELNALAYRQASQEGLEGRQLATRMVEIMNDAPDALRSDAIDTAHMNTFTKPLGEIGQSVTRTINLIPGARLVVPFIRTPANILKYTFSRTPLAYASAAIRADIAAGGARAAQAHARVALGSMVMLTVGGYVADGVITGQGPGDRDLRAAKMRAGWKPYSVHLSGRWYQYNRLEPIGMLFGMGSDIAEIIGQVGDQDAEQLALAGAVAFAQNLASKTWTRGIFEAIAALDPNNPVSDPAKWAVDFTGSVIPFSSLLRNTTQAIDPVLRDTRTTAEDEFAQKWVGDLPEPVAEFLTTMINQHRKNIPGLSDELPARPNLWGDPIETATGLGWVYDFLSPVGGGRDVQDIVDQTIVDNRVKLSMPDRTVNGVRLTGAEYAQFVGLAGKPAKQMLDQMVLSPGFKRLSGGPDGMQAEIIKDVIAKHREQARAQMLAGNPRLRARWLELERDKARSMMGAN